MKITRVRKDEETQIIKMYVDGADTKVIADHFNRNVATILKRLKRNNIPIRNKGYERLKVILTPEQEIQLCEDYKNLIPQDKLREKYNIGWRKVDKILAKYNIPTNPHSSYPNPMQGTHFYKKWIEKHGQEKADEMMNEIKKDWSESSSGANNPMYGKPVPKGAGQGWKGYYKDFYFRSLREISYLLYLDENNIPWETAERKKFIIKYQNYDGTERTYRPDFLVNNNTLVEIKPKRLQNSPLIILKSNAAIKFCEINNLTFQILDFPINADKIKSALVTGLIKFERDYKERFLDYCKKCN